MAQTGTKSAIVRGRRPQQEEERAGFPEPWQTVSKIREEGRGQRIPGKGHLQGALRNIPEMIKWAGCVRAELLTDRRRDRWVETLKAKSEASPKQREAWEVFSVGRIWVPAVASPGFKS